MKEIVIQKGRQGKISVTVEYHETQDVLFFDDVFVEIEQTQKEPVVVNISRNDGKSCAKLFMFSMKTFVYMGNSDILTIKMKELHGEQE